MRSQCCWRWLLAGSISSQHRKVMADTCHGPFDCQGRGSKATGSRCHDECEGRHLDPIEQRRFAEGSGFRYPDRPHVVITASRDMGRTASTWVFNATRLLFRQAKEPCDSYWMRCLDRSKIQHRLETGAHVVIKTHEWTGEMSKASFDEVSPMFTHMIVSVRQGFAEDPAWMKVATHVIHFEELVAYDKDHPEDPAKIGAISVLRKLANHLGLSSLTEHDLRCVDYDLMTLPMPRFGCDQTTKLWPFHGRRGGRPIPRLDPRSE